jgi:PIN domain nuclease of toxin-antitoxin system
MSEIILLDTHIDRLIMATAIVSDCQLASVDQMFPNYPELTGILMRP